MIGLQFAEEAADIRLGDLRRDIELLRQPVADGGRGHALLDQCPDARAGGVEPKIGAAFEVQDHRLVAGPALDGVGGGGERLRRGCRSSVLAVAIGQFDDIIQGLRMICEPVRELGPGRGGDLGQGALAVDQRQAEKIQPVVVAGRRGVIASPRAQQLRRDDLGAKARLAKALLRHARPAPADAAVPGPDVGTFDQARRDLHIDAVAGGEWDRPGKREEILAVNLFRLSGRIGKADTVRQLGVEPQLQAVDHSRPGRDQGDEALGIALLHVAIVEDDQLLGLRQQVGGLHDSLGAHAGGDARARRQVEAEPVVEPRLGVRPVGLGILGQGDADGVAQRDQRSTRAQEARTGVDDGRDMAFEQWQAAADVGDDDIGLACRLKVGGQALDEGDAVGAAIVRRELPAQLDHVVRLDGDNGARAELAGEDGEDSLSGADVDDRASGRHRLAQGLRIGRHARLGRDHAAVAEDIVAGRRSHCVPT